MKLNRFKTCLSYLLVVQVILLIVALLFSISYFVSAEASKYFVVTNSVLYFVEAILIIIGLAFGCKADKYFKEAFVSSFVTMAFHFSYIIFAMLYLKYEKDAYSLAQTAMMALATIARLVTILLILEACKHYFFNTYNQSKLKLGKQIQSIAVVAEVLSALLIVVSFKPDLYNNQPDVLVFLFVVASILLFIAEIVSMGYLIMTKKDILRHEGY